MAMVFTKEIKINITIRWGTHLLDDQDIVPLVKVESTKIAIYAVKYNTNKQEI